MKPFIDHAPGTTAADLQYRVWEQLFNRTDYERRVSALSELGIGMDDLPADIRRSVALLTQSEVGVRLVCSHYDLPESENLDTLALVLRLARSLAQRRGRGTTDMARAFTHASAALLGTWPASASEVERWTHSLELLSSSARPTWDHEEIRVAAESLPLAISVRCAATERDDLDGLVRIFDVGTALDWLILDMKLLLENSPALSHTAPVSDLLTENRSLEHASSSSRVARSLQRIDAYARKLDIRLSGTDPGTAPGFVVEHFQPVLALTQVVATGLQSKGVL